MLARSSPSSSPPTTRATLKPSSPAGPPTRGFTSTPIRYLPTAARRSASGTWPRFAQAHLHGALLHRSAVGRVVVDHERVTRTSGGRPLIVEVIAIYQIDGDGLIASARMIEAG